MTYFVMAHKRDGILENVRIGGYTSKAKAYDRFRKYSTSEIKIYTGSGLKTIAIRINGKEYLQ